VGRSGHVTLRHVSPSPLERLAASVHTAHERRTFYRECPFANSTEFTVGQLAHSLTTFVLFPYPPLRAFAMYGAFPPFGLTVPHLTACRALESRGISSFLLSTLLHIPSGSPVFLWRTQTRRFRWRIGQRPSALCGSPTEQGYKQVDPCTLPLGHGVTTVSSLLLSS